MSLVFATVAIGLVFAVLAFGVYLSFRVYQIPDITADGSFPLAEPESDAIAIAALVSRELTSARIFDPAQIPASRARVESFTLRALGVVGERSGGGSA